MLDVSVSYNRYKFLGHEFLTWLWFFVENHQDRIRKLEPDALSLVAGDHIVLENRRKDAVERISIKGDDAGFEEALLALNKGAGVTELNLAYKVGENEWRFTVKAESLHITGLKCPRTGPMDSQEDLEGAVLEKAYLIEKAIQITDRLFREFLTFRLADTWDRKVVPQMRKWMGA